MLSPLNQAFLRGALETTSGEYVAAVARLQLRARKTVALWADVDLLLTPTLAVPPVPVGWDTEPDDPWEQFDRAARFTPFTAAFNVTGQPAVSLPLHWTEAGLPVGVQLVGPPFGEALLLGISGRSRRRDPGPSVGRRIPAKLRKMSIRMKRTLIARRPEETTKEGRPGR